MPAVGLSRLTVTKVEVRAALRFDGKEWSGDLMDPAELRQRAAELEAELWADQPEDRRGAAELLAAFADYNPALLRRALLGEAGSSAGRDLFADAIECAKDESGD